MRFSALVPLVALSAALAVAGTTPSGAATLQGVTFPDTATVGGQTVKLNGLGLRTKFFFKVYVAALYLATPTRDAQAAIDTDEAKSLVLEFVRDIDHKDMVEAMHEGLAGAATPALEPKMQQFEGFFTEPIKTGQQYEFDYVPGQGTAVQVAGKTKGTIPGADFMRALWAVWLGKNPPAADLKQGLLGGS